MNTDIRQQKKFASVGGAAENICVYLRPSYDKLIIGP